MFRSISLLGSMATIACLALSATGAPAQDAPLPGDPTIGKGPSPMAAECAIKSELVKPTTLELSDQPLSHALEYIRDRHRLEIQFDAVELREAKLDPTTLLVSASLRDVSLRSALNLLLAQHNLAWVVRDEVLMITTKSRADSMFETRLYNVRDLVTRENFPPQAADFDSLAELIRTTVDPQSWDKSGGSGSIAAFNHNGACALVVWQNFSGQERVESLLTELRRLRPQAAGR